MFLFIVYGVGPRHCQNVGCSKSTAKAQLRDTPSVKLKVVKVGKPVHPLSCSAAATFLSLTLGSCWPCLCSAQSPDPPHGRPRTSHTSHFQEGSWAVLPQSQGSRVLSISQEQAAHLRTWAKTLSWLIPWLFPEPEDFPPAAIFTMHQHELAADSIKKHNKT